MTNIKKVDAYQHVRNKSVIYRRVGDTDIFMWGQHKRSEENILTEIEYNQKFEPYFFNIKNNSMIRKILQHPLLWVVLFFSLMAFISIELNK